jgi:hypothetical protein
MVSIYCITQYHNPDNQDINKFQANSFPGKAQRVKLSEGWPKLKFSNFHRILNILTEEQKKVPRRMKM